MSAARLCLSAEKMSRSEEKETGRGSVLRWMAFVAYLVLLSYIMFFAETLGRADAARGYSYNLELFREIGRFIRHRDVLGMRAVLWNLGGNMLCFMPFGFFVPWMWRSADRWYLSVLLSLYLSLLIELTQLFMRVGSFDVDDLLLNTIGGLLGFWCYRLWRRFGLSGK